MKYQIRMIVEVDETKTDGFFKLEDWMCSLPEKIGGVLDFGLAETEHQTLDKKGSWDA